MPWYYPTSTLSLLNFNVYFILKLCTSPICQIRMLSDFILSPSHEVFLRMRKDSEIALIAQGYIADKRWGQESSTNLIPNSVRALLLEKSPQIISLPKICKVDNVLKIQFGIFLSSSNCFQLAYNFQP